MAYDDPMTASDDVPSGENDPYDGAQYDELAANDDGQYEEWAANDDGVPYDELAQSDDGQPGTPPGDAGDDYPTSGADPLVEENPLEDPGPARHPPAPADSSDEDHVGTPGEHHENETAKPDAPPPPRHDEGSTAADGGSGGDGDRDGDNDGNGNLADSRVDATTTCEADYASGVIRTVASSDARVEAVAMDSQVKLTLLRACRQSFGVVGGAPKVRAGVESLSRRNYMRATLRAGRNRGQVSIRQATAHAAYADKVDGQHRFAAANHMDAILNTRRSHRESTSDLSPDARIGQSDNSTAGKRLLCDRRRQREGGHHLESSASARLWRQPV